MRVNYSIARISLFRINIPIFSKNVQFSTKMFGAEQNNKIEL